MIQLPFALQTLIALPSNQKIKVIFLGKCIHKICKIICFLLSQLYSDGCCNCFHFAAVLQVHCTLLVIVSCSVLWCCQCLRNTKDIRVLCSYQHTKGIFQSTSAASSLSDNTLFPAINSDSSQLPFLNCCKPNQQPFLIIFLIVNPDDCPHFTVQVLTHTKTTTFVMTTNPTTK